MPIMGTVADTASRRSDEIAAICEANPWTYTATAPGSGLGGRRNLLRKRLPANDRELARRDDRETRTRLHRTVRCDLRRPFRSLKLESSKFAKHKLRLSARKFNVSPRPLLEVRVLTDPAIP